jgi:hypothetical protein
MADWAEIISYRDFWDVPRIFLARHEGRVFLFDCPFDEDREDFADSYQVFLMPELAADALSGSWVGLSRQAVRHLGGVPVAQVTFDPTKRRQIDSTALAEFFPGAVRLSG